MAATVPSAYIRFSLRFSSSMAFIWLIKDASVTRQGFALQKPERACRHTSPATCRMMHCSCHDHGKARPPATGTPPSAWRRTARIWGSLYLAIFIQNLLVHLAEKILLMPPLTFG